MSIELKAICISTVHRKTLNVLVSSISAYVPNGVEVYIGYCGAKNSHNISGKIFYDLKSTATNYGDAYNFVVNEAFKRHEHVIVCNDDIVFTPTTYDNLVEDYNELVDAVGSENLGWVGCLTDYAIGMQNIRRNIKLSESHPEDTITNIHNMREYSILQTNFIAPICGVISRDSWIDYLPINYFSDNLQCYEMLTKGKKHFISTAYVHHAGSQTVASSEVELNKAWDILKADYPHYYAMLRASQ